jgi:hypothetical protein
MTMPARWGKGPKPDPSVVDLLEGLLREAKTGKVRSLVVVTINPMLEVEIGMAGDSDSVRKRVLSSGLSEAAVRLILKSE